MNESNNTTQAAFAEKLPYRPSLTPNNLLHLHERREFVNLRKRRPLSHAYAYVRRLANVSASQAHVDAYTLWKVRDPDSDLDSFNAMR